ncbi:transmembrane prolyl 4-hydroxylase-like isoform X1 [Montipora capricornis]|uniref:transmembrane prolyl 4-hydroxylase-like isoform X1 n=2 Tax=Montipora capricornis TaxID=246305 RepID=UPI0035F1E160
MNLQGIITSLLICSFLIDPFFATDFKIKKIMKPCFDGDEIENTCSDPSESCHEKLQAKLQLVRLDGFKTGHAKWVNISENGPIKLITRAMKPLVFEIPEFLSHEECDHIISLAKDSGLRTSTSGFSTYDGDLDEDLALADMDWTLSRDQLFAGNFEVWDTNADGIIDSIEVKEFAGKHKKLYLKDDEVQEMFKRLDITDRLKNGKLTPNVFKELNIKKILRYMDFLKTKSPRHRWRFSQHTWLQQDKTADAVLKRLHERVIKLTKLPRKIVQGGEPMQVVRYEKYGHYHAHMDSTIKGPTVPCCHQNYLRAHDCRVCRFVTILYYLNDVEEGGQTAFLLADNTTTTPDDLENSKVDTDEFNLSINCHSANLVIPPKKGTAIMWYNNFIDPYSGLLGDVDRYTSHGGCDVIRGEKWVANNWLTAPTKYSRHIKSMFDNGFD